MPSSTSPLSPFTDNDDEEPHDKSKVEKASCKSNVSSSSATQSLKRYSASVEQFFEDSVTSDGTVYRV